MITDEKIYVKQIEVGPMQNYMYILGDREKKEAVLVDPAWEVDRVLKAAQSDGMHVRRALVTHTHFDHVNGVEDFLNATEGEVFVHAHETRQLRGMKGHIRPVRGGDEIEVGDLTVRFLHTPGHTPGSQCFFISNRLVSGDTLFINACGRCDLPGGSAEEMYRSITGVLMKLSDDVLLLPGHNYAARPTSTIADEKRENPYLRCENLDAFLRLRMG